LIGLVWIALALAGWFDADQEMSVTHGVIGLYLFAMSFAGESTCAFALFASSAACLSFTSYALWLLTLHDSIVVFGSIHATFSTVLLQLGLGIAMAVCGKFNTASTQLIRR
jgi:hypothetical protein